MVLAGHDDFHARADLLGEGGVGHDDPVAVAEGRQAIEVNLQPGGSDGFVVRGLFARRRLGRLLRAAG